MTANSLTCFHSNVTSHAFREKSNANAPNLAVSLNTASALPKDESVGQIVSAKIVKISTLKSTVTKIGYRRDVNVLNRNV